MKNKIVKIVLACAIGLTFLYANASNTFASDIAVEEETISDESDDVQQSDDNIVEEENIEESENTDEQNEPVENNDEDVQSDNSDVFDTDDIFSDDESDVDGIVVDGVEYSGNKRVFVTITSGENATLTTGTKFEITFENMHNDFIKKVTLTTKNINKGINFNLPAGEYEVYTQATENGANSIARLIYNPTDEDAESLLVLEDGQTINFILEGDTQTEEIEKVEETDKTEEKETNFWLELLKNNIIFLILLLGCGVALLVYRLRQDNQ